MRLGLGKPGFKGGLCTDQRRITIIDVVYEKAGLVNYKDLGRGGIGGLGGRLEGKV